MRIGVANGTDALVLALEAMGVGRGDEVICPAFTFYATAEAIARVGATPVFADIDPVTLNLDPDDVAARITERTKAIVPVHLFGRPAPLAELAALGLPLLEDAAQAFGAPGIATTGVCSTFSFFPSKNLFALGDGGLIACMDNNVADTVRKLRFHGSTDKRTFELVGTNSRLDAIHAAALRVFLPHLAGWNRARQSRGRALRRARAGRRWSSCPSTTAPTSTTCTSFERPSASGSPPRSTSAGIASASFYVTPLHLQPAMAYLGYRPGSLPETERAAADNLALPIWAGISAEQQERVVASVRVGRRRRRRSEAAVRSPINRHSIWQVAVDAALVAAAWWLAWNLRFDEARPVYYDRYLDWAIVLLVVGLKLPVFVFTGLLQPLVALRLDARHVGRAPRRRARLDRGLPRLHALRRPPGGGAARRLVHRHAALPRVRRGLAAARAHADRAAAPRPIGRAARTSSSSARATPASSS